MHFFLATVTSPASGHQVKTQGSTNQHCLGNSGSSLEVDSTDHLILPFVFPLKGVYLVVYLVVSMQVFPY